MWYVEGRQESREAGRACYITSAGAKYDGRRPVEGRQEAREGRAHLRRWGEVDGAWWTNADGEMYDIEVGK